MHAFSHMICKCLYLLAYCSVASTQMRQYNNIMYKHVHAWLISTYILAHMHTLTRLHTQMHAGFRDRRLCKGGSNAGVASKSNRWQMYVECWIHVVRVFFWATRVGCYVNLKAGQVIDRCWISVRLGHVGWAVKSSECWTSVCLGHIGWAVKLSKSFFQHVGY